MCVNHCFNSFMSEHEFEESTEDLVKVWKEGSLSEVQKHDLFIIGARNQIRTITVEPLLLFFSIITILQAYVNSQYIYFRVGKDNNIVANETLAHVCEIGSNNSEKNITDRIQALNAQYSMFIQLSTSVCTILTAPFYCVFSDRFGRRIMFIIPAVGVFVKTILEILIQVYELNLDWFIIAEGLYGLCGGYTFTIGLSYSYIADITTQKTRTRRMAILGVIISIAGLLVSLVAGYWIKANGYLIPYIFTCTVCGLCIVYPIFFLKEPPKMPNANRNRTSLLEQLQKLVTVYTNHYPEKSAILVIVLILLNFYYVSEMSTNILAQAYLMAYPICMDVAKIGVFMFVNMVANNIGVGIAILLFVRWFSDLFIVLICLLSGLLFSLQMAFVKTESSTFIAAATNMFSLGAFPFIRGFLSKIVSSEDQGALFGGIVLTETISISITKVIAIYFYGATFRIFHGMVYLLLTGFLLVAIILTLVAIPLNRKMKRVEGSTSTTIN